MDCLALTNEALRESGITLDSLTTANFETPPDPMYTKFKQWTLQSWEDIQLARRDWEFMQKSGVAIIPMRMEIYAGSGANTAAFNGVAFRVGEATNSTAFTSASVAWGVNPTTSAFTVESGSAAASTAEGYLDITSFTSAMPVIEPGDQITNAAETVSARFKRWGRYNLAQATAGYDQISDIGEIKLDSLAICDESTTTDPGDITYSHLKYVSYGDWIKGKYSRPAAIGKPTHFTISNNGLLEFYPPVDTYYNLAFEYTKTPQSFTMTGTGSDTPTDLPTRFHRAISWRAVMYWAEYEGQAQQYARAESRYKKFESDMIRDLLPPVQIKGGTF